MSQYSSTVVAVAVAGGGTRTFLPSNHVPQLARLKPINLQRSSVECLTAFECSYSRELKQRACGKGRGGWGEMGEG